MTRNEKYWIDRANRRMDDYMLATFDVARVIGRSYNGLKTYITSEIAKILRHIGDEDSLAYEYRMKRLAGLLGETERKMKELYGINLEDTTAFLKSIVPEAYYHTMYDVAKGIGEQPDFSAIPKKLVNTIVNDNWSGKNYSKRIWANTDKLAEEVRQVLTDAAISGESINKTTKKLSEAFNQSEYNSRRLIRTETTYACNQAELAAYKELDIQKYKFIATYSKETCGICQKRDGEIIEVVDGKAGTTLPPLHPHCRCTTIAWFDDFEPPFKIARDKDGKNIQIPANMSYDEWKKKYIEPYKNEKKPKKQTAQKTPKIEIPATTEPIRVGSDFFPEQAQDNINKALDKMSPDLAEQYKDILDNAEKEISPDGTAYDSNSNKLVFNEDEINQLDGDTAIHEATHYKDFNTPMTYEYKTTSKVWAKDENGNLLEKEGKPYKVEKEKVTKYDCDSVTDYINYAYDSDEYSADYEKAASILGVNKDNETPFGELVKPEDLEARRKKYREWIESKGIPQEDIPHISDVMSSFVEGQYPFSLVDGGHNASYWNRDARHQYSECMAAYSVLKSRNSPSVEAINEICPNLYKHLETGYKEMFKV